MAILDQFGREFPTPRRTCGFIAPPSQTAPAPLPERLADAIAFATIHVEEEIDEL